MQRLQYFGIVVTVLEMSEKACMHGKLDDRFGGMQL